LRLLQNQRVIAIAAAMSSRGGAFRWTSDSASARSSGGKPSTYSFQFSLGRQNYFSSSAISSSNAALGKKRQQFFRARISGHAHAERCKLAKALIANPIVVSAKAALLTFAIKTPGMLGFTTFRIVGPLEPLVQYSWASKTRLLKSIGGIC